MHILVLNFFVTSDDVSCMILQHSFPRRALLKAEKDPKPNPPFPLTAPIIFQLIQCTFLQVSSEPHQNLARIPSMTWH